MMKDKIQEIREMFNHHGDAYPKEEGIYISHELIERINCFWFRKDNNQKSGQLIIYLHGGAFSLGGISLVNFLFLFFLLIIVWHPKIHFQQLSMKY